MSQRLPYLILAATALVAALLFVAADCLIRPTPNPTPVVKAVTVLPTVTPFVFAAPATPTVTPIEAILLPTRTPGPSATRTPMPTATPVPPTPSQRPVQRG